MAWSADEGALDDVPALDVFAVGRDGDLVPVGPAHDPEPPLDLVAVGTDAINQLREVRATPGPRPGVVTRNRVERRGEIEDVVQPVLVRPGAVRRVLAAGDLFHEPIPGLEVDLESRQIHGDEVAWKATLGRRRFRRGRRASLTLYPTPSANLSVIELIPARHRRFRTRQFVEAGVPVVETVGRRLRRLSRRR